MLWILLLVVTVLWIVQRWWLMRRYRDTAKQLKTNVKLWPIIGHAYKALGNEEDRFQYIQEFAKDAIEVGGTSKIMVFDHLVISIADPVAARLVLNECLEKINAMKVGRTVIGDSSFIASVPMWRRRRRATAPTFSAANVAQFFSIVSKHATIFVEQLQREVDKETFCVSDYVRKFTFNSACEFTLAVPIDAESYKFLTAIHMLWQLYVHVIFRPWFHNEHVTNLIYGSKLFYKNRETVWNFIAKAIKNKRDTVVQTSIGEDGSLKKMPSFLGRQLEIPEKHRLSDLELHEECLTLVAGGLDTSAVAISFTIVLLSQYSDVQDKVYEELQEVFGESNQPATYEDIRQLKYLEAVINETMRLYPMGPVVGRQIDKDLKLPSGVVVPAGCNAFIFIWALHRHPLYWGPDADHFRPERFLDFTPKHPAMFIPFSSGPRNCIGYRYAMMSMKTVLASFLRRYRVLAPPGIKPGEPLRVGFNAIIRHIDNYQVQLRNRK